ncbi:hypothetical protein NKG94_07715 [Micromonospora sp. M12]
MRGTLRGRPDVDEQGPGPVRQVRLLRVQPAQPGTGLGQDLVNAPEPGGGTGLDRAQRLFAFSVPSGDKG